MSIQSLIETDQPATVMEQASPGLVNSSGLPVNNLVAIRGIQGHCALNSAQQTAMWSSLGIDADYRFATLDLNVKNGQFIQLQDGRLFRVLGVPRRYGKGNIPTFFVIPLKQEFTQGDLD